MIDLFHIVLYDFEISLNVSYELRYQGWDRVSIIGKIIHIRLILASPVKVLSWESWV